jgi:hypothetical protein
MYKVIFETEVEFETMAAFSRVSATSEIVTFLPGINY